MPRDCTGIGQQMIRGIIGAQRAKNVKKGRVRILIDEDVVTNKERIFMPKNEAFIFKLFIYILVIKLIIYFLLPTIQPSQLIHHLIIPRS